MAVFDALRYLSVHLRENHPVNHLADLYELVQYAGNIVPRLYLMITVGTAYMSIEGAPVKELMKDMMDMSRCITDDGPANLQGPNGINSIQNGLLLQSGIHDLWDNYDLSVNPDVSEPWLPILHPSLTT